MAASVTLNRTDLVTIFNMYVRVQPICLRYLPKRETYLPSTNHINEMATLEVKPVGDWVPLRYRNRVYILCKGICRPN